MVTISFKFALLLTMGILIVFPMVSGCEPEKPFDVNGDGKVDMRDIAIAASAFGSRRGCKRYNKMVDFDNDGAIDWVDLGLIAVHFGEVCND